MPVTQQAGGVGEEEEAVGLERRGQLEGELVAVDVDRHALFAERGRGEHRHVAVLQQEPHQRGVD